MGHKSARSISCTLFLCMPHIDKTEEKQDAPQIWYIKCAETQTHPAQHIKRGDIGRKVQKRLSKVVDKSEKK